MANNRMRQLSVHQDDPLRELFESCKTGDLIKVRKLINPQTVNARDTAGRKSTPLHFAAGKCEFILLKYNPSYAAAALRHVIYVQWPNAPVFQSAKRTMRNTNDIHEIIRFIHAIALIFLLCVSLAVVTTSSLCNYEVQVDSETCPLLCVAV